MFQSTLKVGEEYILQKQISEKDIEITIGTGELHALVSTPVLVALMIEASVRLVDPKLQSGFITAGQSVNVKHMAPSTLGQILTMKAKVVRIENFHVFLEIEAYDEIGQIGSGTHERIVVNKDNMLKRAAERAEGLIHIR